MADHDPAYVKFAAAKPGEWDELVGIVAYWKFQTEERAFRETHQRVYRRPISKRDLEEWRRAHLEEPNVERFMEDALHKISASFNASNAELLNSKVEEASRAAEAKYLGDLKKLIQDWALAQLQVNARLGKIEAFWRNVAINGLSGLVASVVSLILTGLLAFGLVYKDAVKFDMNGIQIQFPRPASAASYPG